MDEGNPYVNIALFDTGKVRICMVYLFHEWCACQLKLPVGSFSLCNWQKSRFVCIVAMNWCICLTFNNYFLFCSSLGSLLCKSFPVSSASQNLKNIYLCWIIHCNHVCSDQPLNELIHFQPSGISVLSLHSYIFKLFQFGETVILYNL